MNTVIEMTIYFLASYVLTFLFYTFVVNRKKSKKRPMEMDYILAKFHIDERKINMNNLKWILNVVNPFIVAVTFLVVMCIDSFILGIVIGFIIMLLLIYSIYEIIGRYLKGKVK